MMNLWYASPIMMMNVYGSLAVKTYWEAKYKEALERFYKGV